MAPKFAPKVWKRPYTSIYNDNYRYGNSLYSDAVDEIERKYNEALANTRFRRDRADLGLSTFADSQLTGESVARSMKTKAANDSLASELTRSLSTERVNSFLEANEHRRTAHQLASSPSFDSYYSQRMNNMNRQMDRLEADLDESRLRRSASSRARSMGRSTATTRPESAYFTRQSSYELTNGDLGSVTGSAPRDTFWMERCNELLKDVEQLRLDVAEYSNKVKNEQVMVKQKVEHDVQDLMLTIEDQDRQLADLQKQLRKQAKQISDISLELQASQRQYADVSDQLGVSQKRANNLSHELEEMKTNLEKSHVYTNFAKELSKMPSSTSIPEHYNVKRDPRFQLMDG